MRSSLAWCLEPQWCEREAPPIPGSHRKGAYIRKTKVLENFARIKEEAYALKMQGLTGREIAFRLGVGRDSVYEALRQQGQGTRTLSKAK